MERQMFFPSRRSGPSRLSCLFVLLSLTACGRSPSDSKASEAPADWFSERAHASGLDFTHFNGMSGHFYYPEIMGPGVAVLDYDNDGDLDVYVTQGQMLSVDGKTPPPADTPVLKDHLF